MKAIIFDFDGTIMDTERAEMTAWQQLYDEFNHVMPFEQWARNIGRGEDLFDPLSHLESLVGKKLDCNKLAKQRQANLSVLLTALKPLPGVTNWIAMAKELGMKLAIATASHHRWASGHLERMNLLHHFDYVVTRDDVKNLKPHPEVYQLALQKLGINSEQAIAIEDSPNGATAAISAGLRCIIVPSTVTTTLTFPATFCKLQNLEERSLRDVLQLI